MTAHHMKPRRTPEGVQKHGSPGCLPVQPHELPIQDQSVHPTPLDLKRPEHRGHFRHAALAIASFSAMPKPGIIYVFSRSVAREICVCLPVSRKTR